MKRRVRREESARFIPSLGPGRWDNVFVEALNFVKPAHFVNKDMYDNVAVIDQDPLLLAGPFRAKRAFTHCLAHIVQHGVGDGTNETRI